MVCGVWGLAHFLLKEYFIQHNCADIISAGFLLVRKDKALIFLRPQGLFISTETKAGPQFWLYLLQTYDRHIPRGILLFGMFMHIFGLIMASISEEHYQLLLSQVVCSATGSAAIFQPGKPVYLKDC
jgi:hypothetical protein